ncbi:transposable element Tcb1 transposase [Trichonephila clavipes]|nr:transposable element Tcb1 transposase [Trichonephila clavipes]
MQDSTTARSGGSHSPQCTTSREYRQIGRMAVTYSSVTSRIVAQLIESVTHHLVSARTIQYRVQQSGLSLKRPFFDLHLTQNLRRVRRQWCDERRIWTPEWNGVTDESRICLQHHDDRIQVWRHRGERMLNDCVMQCHTGSAPGIMVWGGIGYPSRTPPVRITGLDHTIFKQDNARPHVTHIVQRFSVNHQIELLPSPARSPDLSPIENMWFMVAQRLIQITPPAVPQIVPQGHIQSLFRSMPRRVTAVKSNNVGYSGY